MKTFSEVITEKLQQHLEEEALLAQQFRVTPTLKQLEQLAQFYIQQDLMYNQLTSLPELAPYLSGLQYGTHSGLSNEPMSLDKQERLTLAQYRIPRFLYRVYGRESGGAESDYRLSGRHPNLNTRERITPHAFLYPNNTFPSCFDMSETTLATILDDHVHGRPNFCDVFSSWTASLEAAIWYAEDKNEDFVNLAVLDTETICRDRVFHVQQLWRAGYLQDHSKLDFTAEYVIHGVVEGRGLFCQPLTGLVNCGLAPLLSHRQCRLTKELHVLGELDPEPTEAVSEEALDDLVAKAADVAMYLSQGQPQINDTRQDEQRRTELLVYVTAALLGLRFYLSPAWSDAELSLIVWTVMQKIHPWQRLIPSGFWHGVWLRDGMVYARDYPEMTRTLHILGHMKQARMRGHFELA